MARTQVLIAAGLLFGANALFSDTESLLQAAVEPHGATKKPQSALLISHLQKYKTPSQMNLADQRTQVQVLKWMDVLLETTMPNIPTARKSALKASVPAMLKQMTSKLVPEQRLFLDTLLKTKPNPKFNMKNPLDWISMMNDINKNIKSVGLGEEASPFAFLSSITQLPQPLSKTMVQGAFAATPKQNNDFMTNMVSFFPKKNGAAKAPAHKVPDEIKKAQMQVMTHNMQGYMQVVNMAKDGITKIKDLFQNAPSKLSWAGQVTHELGQAVGIKKEDLNKGFSDILLGFRGFVCNLGDNREQIELCQGAAEPASPPAESSLLQIAAPYDQVAASLLQVALD